MKIKGYRLPRGLPLRVDPSAFPRIFSGCFPRLDRFVKMLDAKFKTNGDADSAASPRPFRQRDRILLLPARKGWTCNRRSRSSCSCARKTRSISCSSGTRLDSSVRIQAVNEALALAPCLKTQTAECASQSLPFWQPGRKAASWRRCWDRIERGGPHSEKHPSAQSGAMKGEAREPGGDAGARFRRDVPRLLRAAGGNAALNGVAARLASELPAPASARMKRARRLRSTPGRRRHLSLARDGSASTRRTARSHQPEPHHRQLVGPLPRRISRP